MIPFTTPKHIFKLPYETSLIEEARIVYEQNGLIVLEKALEDCTAEGNVLTLKLSQEETGRFKDNMKAKVQIHVRMKDGEVWATPAKRVNVEELLKREVL